MGLSDTGKAFLIVIIFSLIQLSITLSIGLTHLKNNWNKYRCNPLVIPLAGLVEEDPSVTFTECTKEIQFDFMKTILKSAISFEILGGQSYSPYNAICLHLGHPIYPTQRAAPYAFVRYV